MTYNIGMNHKIRHQFPVFIVFAFLFLFSPKLHTKCEAAAIEPDAPIQLFLIERTGVGKDEKITFSKTKTIFLKDLKLAGFHILDDLEPPFVSKGMVRYGASKPGGTGPSGIGYVHLSLTDDDQTRYLSDNGSEVILKSSPDKVVWTFEPKKAIEMADKAGMKYAFVIEVGTQMIYQDDSPKPVYQVSLKSCLYQTDNATVVFQHEESMVKLADDANSAMVGACRFLSPELTKEMENELFGGGPTK